MDDYRGVGTDQAEEVGTVTVTADPDPDPAPGPGQPEGAPPQRERPLRPVLWRLHFLGGFLAAPVVLSLALTGVLFAWNPQIEAVLHTDALTAVAAGQPQPLSEQVAAAGSEHPGWTLMAVTPAAEPGATTGVTLAPEGAGGAESEPVDGATTVYVDPASATVTGQIVETSRPSEWLRTLHSSWHLGPMAEPLTELAASWVLVSLLTGLYLWWPRGKRGWARLLRPRWRAGGRRAWRDVHTTLGVGIFVLLLGMVGTGLTWTNYAGAWLDAVRAGLSSGTPAVSTGLAAESTGHHVAAPQGGDAGGIDTVAASAARAGLSGPLEITPAGQAGSAWTVATVDDRWPVELTTVAVDPGSGQVVDRVGWADYPLLAKATTLGIDFHQATLFGLANQILLTAMAIALVGLIVAGYRMWWRRRPAGGLGAPPRVGPLLRTVPVPLLVGFAVLMVALPTLGVSFLVYLAVERVVRSVRCPARSGA